MYVVKNFISKLYRKIAKQPIRILKIPHTVFKTIPSGLKLSKGFTFIHLKRLYPFGIVHPHRFTIRSSAMK